MKQSERSAGSDQPLAIIPDPFPYTDSKMALACVSSEQPAESSLPNITFATGVQFLHHSWKL